MLFWISLFLFLAAIGVVSAIFVRHWKEIRLLDPDSIKAERMRQVREHVITQRFQRVKSTTLAPLAAVAKKGMLTGKKMFHAAYIKLIRIDRLYKQAKAPFAAVAPSTTDRVKALMDDARSLARDLKWADAERRYVEVLAIDDHHIDAYKGLGAIYLKQKLYPQARETFEFLVKIAKDDETCFASLGEINEAEGRDADAEKMYQKAVELQPRQPAYAVQLASFYLSRDKAEDAWPLLVRAVELQPKSAKYLELAIDGAIRTGRRAEATSYYDAYRFLATDKQKVRSLKEKMENTEGTQ